MEDPRRLEREEVQAALEVRHELGPAYEPAVVDSLAERIEAVIATRVDARVAERERRDKVETARGGRQQTLALASLALGIPISAVSAGIADLPGLMVAWAGIVGVNAMHAWQSRPSPGNRGT